MPPVEIVATDELLVCQFTVCPVIVVPLNVVRAAVKLWVVPESRETFRDGVRVITPGRVAAAVPGPLFPQPTKKPIEANTRTATTKADLPMHPPRQVFTASMIVSGNFSV
jgi:hypothetical protein